MHKILVFLKRRAGAGRAGFFGWWLGAHRERVVQVPGLRRYTASLEAEGIEGAFDGLATLWFDDAAAATAGLANPQGRSLAADMRAHASRVEQLAVADHTFVDAGPAPFKLVAALKRRPDLTRAAFASWWLDRHAPQVVAFPELRRYCVNIVRGDAEDFVDGVAEVGFADLEALRRVTSSAQVKGVQGDSQVHTSARYRMLAEERPLVG